MNNRTTSKGISYGVGALVTTLISVGVVIILYGTGFLVFNLLSLMACILAPLGTYTIVYALIKRKDILYYISWGLIILTIGLASVSYNVMNPLVIFGVLLIGLAIIGLAAYWRRREVGESS
ncbi:MAG: hypothetical protein QXP86_04635 [Nitrososphaerota archaeon]